MNELQAIAIAALDAIKNEEVNELVRLHTALRRTDISELDQVGSALDEAEARHRRICDAIDWVKAIPQLDHITTHKAAELRSRGYKDIGVVLQDELGSTAVIAHGKVTWNEPNLTIPVVMSLNMKQKYFEKMAREKFPKLDLSMTSRFSYVDPEVRSMWIGYKEGFREGLCEPSQTTIVDATTTITSLNKDSAKSVTFMPTQTIKYDAEAAKAIIKNAILSNSHPAPDWHLAFTCADEIDIVANQITIRFAELANQQTATPCGQVTTTETGQHTCTTMRVGDEKICPDCSPKRNFLAWLGEQVKPDYYVSSQHGELKASYTDESDPAYKWIPVIALSKVQS